MKGYLLQSTLQLFIIKTIIKIEENTKRALRLFLTRPDLSQKCAYKVLKVNM
jgi:hypothetical protein